MPKYLIRRELPGAGALSTADLQSVAAKSNAVLAQLGPAIQWVQTYVSGDALTCVYNSENEELIREHARMGGFPCTEITRVSTVIDPVTGEG